MLTGKIFQDMDGTEFNLQIVDGVVVLSDSENRTVLSIDNETEIKEIHDSVIELLDEIKDN